MTRPADAIVTGFTRNGELCRRAFAPLLDLRRQGIIRNVHYVTWDSGEIDEYVAPAAAFNGVRLTRVKQPDIEGNRNQRGFVYQTRNLHAALGEIAEPDALLVKLRPDFVFRADFLTHKLREFDRLCAPPAPDAFTTMLPDSPFKRKIWIPWADASQPFFFEDAAFIGLKRDLALLAEQDLDSAMPLLKDESCGQIVHVLRYINVFLDEFPIFARYVSGYRPFVNDLGYRKILVPLLLGDGFFWHMLVAHAHILRTSFHVDCGDAGDLSFYPNFVNRNSDWNAMESLILTAPYNQVAMWRQGTQAGSAVMPAVMRTYGRLMDDAWPCSLFTAKLSDMPEGMLARLARGVALYRTGCLKEIEQAFYGKLNAFHRQHWLAKQAA